MNNSNKTGNVFLCHVCDEPACLFCTDCKKHYCEECSTIVHKKRLKYGHKITPIDTDASEVASAPPITSPVAGAAAAASSNSSSSSSSSGGSGSSHRVCPDPEYFCLDDNEVFCRACFDQNHRGHSVIRLEDALTNFALEKYVKAFSDAFAKTQGLLERIDGEVSRLGENIAHVRSAISESFGKLHAALDAEEHALLNQLEAETSCTEQQLTEVLQGATEQVEQCRPLVDKYVATTGGSSSNSNSSDCTATSNSENIAEMFKAVQKMEQATEEMRRLQLIPLAGLSARYDSAKRKLDFERFAFSGLQVPKCIVFSDVACTSLCVSWRVCDPVAAFKDGVRYLLEMRPEPPEPAVANGGSPPASAAVFKIVYEGPECSCRVDHLVRGWSYTFRVCCVLDKCRGRWSAEQRVRTLNIKLESNILLQADTTPMVRLSEWCGTRHFELLYRASWDGMTAADFHRKCDGQGETVTIVKSTNGCIFGGYASVPWGKDGKGHKAPNSFLFTLKNLHGLPPQCFPLKNRLDKNAVFHYSNCGVAFGKGADLIIYTPFNTNTQSHTDFVTYQDTTGKGLSVLSGERNFVVSEVEVFKVMRLPLKK